MPEEDPQAQAERKIAAFPRSYMKKEAVLALEKQYKKKPREKKRKKKDSSSDRVNGLDTRAVRPWA